MHVLIYAAILLFAPPSFAEQVLKVTQLAEFTDGLSQPHDAAFSADGKLIYVADMRNSRIRVFEAMTLKPVGMFGVGELSYPHDAEFDRDGRLLVADTGNDRIAIYRIRGAEAQLVGEIKGLEGPEGVAIAPDGRIIATNTRGDTLAVFRDGKLERTLGGQGAKDSQFSNPHDVEAAADGRIYVADSGNDRVQIFDSGLNHRGSFGSKLELSGPKYLTIDGDHIWLADEYNHRILWLDHRGRLLGVLGTGKRGRGPNAYNKPEAVLARSPHVWVIDTYNDRIVLLRVENARPR